MYLINSDHAKKTALEEVKSLPLNGSWAVSIDPYEKIRSKAQSRFFHKLCTVIGKDLGYDKEEIKDGLKLSVFGIQIRIVKGTELRELKSTADMSVEDLHTLIDAAMALGFEMGIKLPTTNFR